MGDKLTTYNKGSAEIIEPDDLTALTELAVTSLKRHGGKPAKFENSECGLALFMQKSQDFFEYVNDINGALEAKQRLIPDIEAWTCFLGITRQTLSDYSKRNQQWQEAIEMIKNAILMAKKQLAMRNRIPSLIFLFDATNNHSYHSTSEFHLVAEKPQEEATPTISTEEITGMLESIETPKLPE